LTKKPLNILYLLADRGHDLSLHQGYTVHVKNILQGLKTAGNHPFLLTINSQPKLPGFEQYKTIPHKYIRLVHNFFPYTGLFNSIRIYWNIISLHQKYKFDLIHERYGLYSMGGVWASHLLKLPYVLEVNAPLIEEKSLFTAPLSGCQLRMAKRSTFYNFKKADQIIAVSSTLKYYLQQKWSVDPNKIFVLPNASDGKKFNAVSIRKKQRAHLGLNGETVVGYVGTFQPWFGIENLIKAFVQLKQGSKNLVLMLVGDGAAKSSCKQLAEQYHVSSQVLFIESVPHEQVPQFLSVIDIAVAPYTDLPMGFYGSSLKVFEYMAAGKAIIASELGQIKEVLQNEKNALLVQPGNVSQLSDAINRLVKDDSLRTSLGKNAKHELSKFHRWETYIKKLESVYEAVL